MSTPRLRTEAEMMELARAEGERRAAERRRLDLDKQSIVDETERLLLTGQEHPTQKAICELSARFTQQLADFRGTTEKTAAEQILVDKTEEALLGVTSGELVESSFEVFEGVAEKDDHGRK